MTSAPAEQEPYAPGSNEWWIVRRVANGDARKPWYELTDEDRAALGQPTRTEGDELREALTPSADTKAAYIGEFKFDLRRVDEFGDEYALNVTVPWTTVKEIMSAIRKRAALSTPQQGERS